MPGKETDVTSQFVQITGTKYNIFALDGLGQVWKYQESSRRICDEPHHSHACEYQTVEWWNALATVRGFLGWPLTEHERAVQEVDELLK